MSTGQKIQKLRVRANLSQEEFAEMVHVSRQTISKWENDVCIPSIQNLLVICKLMNLQLNDFFEEHKKACVD